MTASISRTFMRHDLWDADHRPRVECEPNWLPSSNWTHLWRELLPSLGDEGLTLQDCWGWPPCHLWQTHCGTWIRSDQFPVLWHHAVAAHYWTETKTEPSSPDQRSPWTPACQKVCANLWPWCSDWSSSTDELTGPLDASSVGRHCETSSVELHPNELEVLTWCEIGLLEVDDLAKNWSILKVVWACSWACSGVSALISQSSK